MTLTAFLLLLLSVTFHASWNLLAKKSVMSIACYAIICVSATCCWLHMQFWTPVDVLGLPGKYYLFMACSVVSDVIYCLGLTHAYRTMEMSTAYPMMRALPLLLTAVITTAFGWGAPLSGMAIAGMTVVFVGCLMMPLASFRNFRWNNYINSNLLFILLVACGTTGYTVFDSKAQEILRSSVVDVSKPVLSLTYYSCRGILLGSTLLAIVFSVRGERTKFLDFFRSRNFNPVFAGLFATCAYSLVLIAMNYVCK